MRLPLDDAGRDDRAGQPDVRGAGPAACATTWSGDAASRTCSAAGGRIYHETHYAPLLRMQGPVREIAVEIVRADGTRLPALVNSVLRHDDDGRAARRSARRCFDATDRRRYEEELLRAREQRARDRARAPSAACSPGSCPRTGASRSASPTGPPSAASRSAATGTTRSGSTTPTALGRGRRRRRRARDRRRGDDGPAAQRGPRARLDRAGPGGGCSTRSTRTPAATRSGRWRPSSTRSSTSARGTCATPAPGTRRR